MKKVFAIMVVAALMLSLVACGTATTSQTTAPATSASAAPATSASVAPATSASTAASSDYTALPYLEQYKQYKYDGHINVLYLVCTTAAEYFPNSYAVWKPMMEKKNISIDLMGPPTYSDDSLIATLESELAAKKYDIVVLYPITPGAITPLLDDVWNTYHVPILSYAFSPDTKSGHYFLGTSYYAAGTVLGKAIVDYVNANKDYFSTLKTIPVAVYINPQGAEQYKRIQGAEDVLKADGRFTIIKEYAANGEAACLTQTETVLTDRPDTEVILGQIDNDVTGAYQAITSGTYKHSSHISLWGFDATGATSALMLKDGPTGPVQGSSFIDHKQAGEALCELIPILVGAAKQQKLIEFDKTTFDKLGTGLADYYKAVTPANVKDYYTPKAS